MGEDGRFCIDARWSRDKSGRDTSGGKVGGGVKP